MTSIKIELGTSGDIESLRDLWLELHHHHAVVAPQTGEFTDDETSWANRSASYRDWLADPRSFVLLARDAGELVGYCVVRVFDPSRDEWDSWIVPDVIAEIETLVVAERARGRGVGSQLLDAADAELERAGVTEVVIGLMPGNDGAQRLYERRGFVPRWLALRRGS
jgi:ribosomal protein S18 acetylase RimI-like enzyme